MDKYKKLQSLLLRWLMHHQQRNLSQVKKACNDLFDSFEDSSGHYIYKLFYPLLRMGLVEFCGKGKFGLSPSCVLLYPKHEIAVGVNLPTNEKTLLKSVDSDLGFTRFPIESSSLFSETKCYEPDCINMLKNFPKVREIISTYDTTFIQSKGEVFDSDKRKWSQSDKQGIFRLDNESVKRYLKTTENVYEIPLSEENPESRHLAEAHSARLNNLNCFFYNKSNKSLTVKYIDLPILVERVLRTFSLYRKNGVVESYNEKVFNDIPVLAIKELKRIFEMEIKKC